MLVVVVVVVVVFRQTFKKGAGFRWSHYGLSNSRRTAAIVCLDQLEKSDAGGSNDVSRADKI